MQPKKIWSNLPVTDLERTNKFYTELGFRSNGRSEELTSFFIGEDNFVMHFFLKDILKASMKAEIADAHKANEIIFTLSAKSKEEVDLWANEVEEQEENLFQGQKPLEKDITGLFLQTPMGIGSMFLYVIMEF